MDDEWENAGFRAFNNTVIQSINSVLSTCLISYSTLVSIPAQVSHCTQGSIHEMSGALSLDRIADCWLEICDYWTPYVNLDFGGIGVGT